MRKHLIILILVCCWTNWGLAQTTDNYSDEILTSSFKIFRSADFELRDYILPFLRKRFIKEIQDTASFSNPYDSLSNYITIRRSVDKLLNIYCWNERNSGCRWSYTTFAQFKTKSGKIKTVNFEKVGADYDEDLYISELQKIEINNEPHYLVIGYGGHCGNHIYAIARVYKIVNNSIIKCDAIFGNESEIESGTSRTGKIEMRYSSERKILSYYKYIFDEHYGFYSNKKSMIKWKLTKEGFRKINK